MLLHSNRSDWTGVHYKPKSFTGGLRVAELYRWYIEGTALSALRTLDRFLLETVSKHEKIALLALDHNAVFSTPHTAKTVSLAKGSRAILTVKTIPFSVLESQLSKPCSHG